MRRLRNITLPECAKTRRKVWKIQRPALRGRQRESFHYVSNVFNVGDVEASNTFNESIQKDEESATSDNPTAAWSFRFSTGNTVSVVDREQPHVIEILRFPVRQGEASFRRSCRIHGVIVTGIHLARDRDSGECGRRRRKIR